jgi:putative two-component system response regulator
VTKVLVIDDEAVVREVITAMLAGSGYEVVCASTAAEGLELFADESIRLVITDVFMPDGSGLELLETMRIRRPNLPIVLVTGATTRDDLSEALARGADGFVAKPFTHTELELALTKALDRAGRSERDLRDRLLAPTLTSALANAIEAREEGMRGHAERLTRLAMRLAAEVGLGEKEIETIRLGALLHDVGKIGIPDSVLLKPSALTDEERLLMRAHTEIGDHLLEPLELLAAVRPIVRHHHERWDGLGYPDRLSGSAIPLGARIMSVADAVDAMSATRVYRAALPQVEIVREIERGRGSQWDPALVDHTLKLIESGAVSFAPDGLEIAESSPGAAVLRFPGPKARRTRRRHLGEAAQ